MKHNQFLIIKVMIFTVMIITVSLSSCTKDLNITPLNTGVQTPLVVYADTANYIKTLAKLYGGLNITSENSTSISDIQNGDEGVPSFLRGLFACEEMSTDECVNVWGDADLFEYHNQNVTDINSYNTIFYERIFFNIAECNEYIRQVQPRVGGLTGTIHTEVTYYLAEARFLRALWYYYAIDMWANPPFVTENTALSALPPQIKRADLFNYVVKELRAVSHILLPPNQQAQYYGRANRAAAWTLLAKCYLNAQVFTGTAKYDSCYTYCDSIINQGGYSLLPTYANLFLADNNVNGLSEFIFPIVENAVYSQNYGGVTFIINASTNSDADNTAYYGVGGWAGNLATATFFNSWTDLSGKTDTRILLRPTEAAGTIAPLAALSQADWNVNMQLAKFRNVTSTGTPGVSTTFASTNFPLFRLGDVYLMHAEAALNLNNAAQAVTDFNIIRQRAYGNATGNVATVALTDILPEREHELYWECQRRTDLIRFGQFSNGSMVWDWKGGVIGGESTPASNNIYPIPNTDLLNNPNLVQN